MSNNNEIYTTLKQEILSLTLAPGQYIGEVEISKRFNVSRTPIREVFKRLEYENLIRAIPNKGTIITPIDFETITEFMYFREKLEISIIDELIHSINAASIAQLSLVLIKQRKLVEDTSIDLLTRALLFYDLDNQFHQTIFTAANKSSLWFRLMSLMPDYQRYRAIAAEFNTENDLRTLFDHHKLIFELIKSKDFVALRDLYKVHIYNGVNTFDELLSQKENYFVI